MKKNNLLILAAVVIFVVSCKVKEDADITSDEIYNHVKYLASDELKGRYPGTNGDSLTVDYIISSLKKSGFKDKNIEKQEFEVVNGIKNLGDNLLSFDENTIPDSLFAPFPFSETGEIQGNLVFVGYGFQINTKELKWDDYTSVDVENKIAVILKGDPLPDSSNSVYSSHNSDINKALTAKDNGAIGVIFVSGSSFDNDDVLIELKGNKSNIGIPVIQIKRETFNTVLENTTINELEENINNTLEPNSFELAFSANLKLNLEIDKRKTFNVIATINAANFSKETIVLGAHYDHLGMGGEGSSSRKRDTVAVHNGADDNASGVAGVLEIAEKLIAQKDELKRNFVFVFFSAEEMGLLGSKYFVENTSVEVSDIIAMVNLDMIGRMKADSSIQIGGTGTSLETKDILNDINADFHFKIAMSDAGYGPSDHASFYAKDIPVFFISSGAHPDYHTPDDDLELLNIDGIKMIANFASEILFSISEKENKLTFQEAGPKTNSGGGRNYKVTLGIMPDFTSTENKGLGVDFVSPGRPAENGGVKKGDLIIAIDGKPIKNIYEYMYRMEKYNVGDRITVTVKRGEKEEVLLIQL